MVKILSIFVAFLENMNFNNKRDIGFEKWQNNKEYALLLDK